MIHLFDVIVLGLRGDRLLLLLSLSLLMGDLDRDLKITITLFGVYLRIWKGSPVFRLPVWQLSSWCLT